MTSSMIYVSFKKNSFVQSNFFHLSKDVTTPEQNMGLLSPRYLWGSVILQACKNRAALWSMCHFLGECLGGWDVVGEQKHGSAQAKPSDVQLNSGMV